MQINPCPRTKKTVAGVGSRHWETSTRDKTSDSEGMSERVRKGTHTAEGARVGPDIPRGTSGALGIVDASEKGKSGRKDLNVRR